MFNEKLSRLTNSKLILDFFLDFLCSRNEVVNVFLKNSLKLSGKIVLYDQDCILLARNITGDIQLIRLDSVATVVPSENKVFIDDLEKRMDFISVGIKKPFIPSE